MLVPSEESRVISIFLKTSFSHNKKNKLIVRKMEWPQVVYYTNST